MTTNIHLARLLAAEREQEILRHVERQQRVRAAKVAQHGVLRLVRLGRSDQDVTEDTRAAA